jgi:hypothetical protein
MACPCWQAVEISGAYGALVSKTVESVHLEDRKGDGRMILRWLRRILVMKKESGWFAVCIPIPRCEICRAGYSVLYFHNVSILHSPSY